MIPEGIKAFYEGKKKEPEINSYSSVLFQTSFLPCYKAMEEQNSATMVRLFSIRFIPEFVPLV